MVAWHYDGGLQCDCSDSGDCMHLQYVYDIQVTNDGLLIDIPDSADMTTEDMEALVADPKKLRDWMFVRVPIIDTNNDEKWLAR